MNKGSVTLTCIFVIFFTALVFLFSTQKEDPGNNQVETRSNGNNQFSFPASLAKNRRFDCVKEMFLPSASHHLFDKAISQSDGKDIVTFQNKTAKMVPVDSWELETKRNFIAWITQTAEPSRTIKKTRKNLMLKPFHVPTKIHAMSGGLEGYVKGGLYNADMVMEAMMLSDVCTDFFEKKDMTVLDFGGSTGRSMTMFKAAFDNIEAHVCDPIGNSIDWIKKNVPTVQGYKSPIKPPTSYKDDKFDLVFAISIWSHYNFASNGLEWLEEMHRIIKPHGYLVITTHGFHAIHSKVTDLSTSKIIHKNFKEEGHWYHPSFGNNIDWDKDTQNPDWGMSWVDPDWLARKLVGKFEPRVLLNGRSDCLQDVLVFQRVN